MFGCEWFLSLFRLCVCECTLLGCHHLPDTGLGKGDYPQVAAIQSIGLSVSDAICRG